jgi:protein TonB
MMAGQMDNAVYSPYGAFELKAKYQRNFLLSTLGTLTFVLLILGISWLIRQLGQQDVVAAEPVIIKTVAELGPPPTVAKKPPQIKVERPDIVAPKVGIPKPVADEDVLDEDVQLATREELAEIVAPDIASEGPGSGDIVVDIQDEDYLPAIDEFVPVEIVAEMIYKEPAEYPRLARQAGLEGTVWVKALVTKDGSVADAVVYKSSGIPSLDEAAVKAALKYKYKPAIQNGRPVAMWVAYPVNFVLDQ